MNEAEWSQGNNPHQMLHALAGLNPTGNVPSRMRDPVLDRKFRLFAVACGRLVEARMLRGIGTAAINIAERFADGMATKADLKAAKRAAWAAWRDLRGHPRSTALWTAAWVADWTVVNAASQAVSGVLNPAWQTEARIERVRTHLCEVIRDIFGNPFCTPGIAPTLLCWNDGTVVKVARAIYEARAFDRLPVLADALEEASCHDTDILKHCRNPEPHVRGCWILDLLTGRT
jgi:hypothetical protein